MTNYSNLTDKEKELIDMLKIKSYKNIIEVFFHSQ